MVPPRDQGQCDKRLPEDVRREIVDFLTTAIANTSLRRAYEQAQVTRTSTLTRRSLDPSRCSTRLTSQVRAPTWWGAGKLRCCRRYRLRRSARSPTRGCRHFHRNRCALAPSQDDPAHSADGRRRHRSRGRRECSSVQPILMVQGGGMAMSSRSMRARLEKRWVRMLNGGDTHQRRATELRPSECLPRGRRSV